MGRVRDLYFIYTVAKAFTHFVCRRTKKKDIYVISTLKRPVPLEHHLYAGKELYKIVGANETKLNGTGYVSCKTFSVALKFMSIVTDTRLPATL